VIKAKVLLLCWIVEQLRNLLLRRLCIIFIAKVWKIKSPMYVKVATGAEQKVENFVKIGVCFNSNCVSLSFRVIDMDSQSHNLETFTLKGLTRDYHTLDTIQNAKMLKMGMECDGSIFIMHQSIPFECRSEKAIQAQDTITSGIATLLAGYSDVFPPKLPDSLPPHREVDHRIDLTPGSVPPGL